MSIRLYVGNLPNELEREELEAVFADSGMKVSTKLVTDRKTGKCRGFGFVTVETDEEADALIEKFNGQSFKESELKIEKALPRSKGKDEATATAEEGGAAAGGGNSGGGGGGGARRRSGGGSKSRSGSGSRVASSAEPEGFQPDPRWAGDLAKLKEMLAAQNG